MDNKTAGIKLLNETIGISIEIISNDFEEYAGNTHQKILFQITLEDGNVVG